MRKKAGILNGDAVERTIKRMASEIIERNGGAADLAFIGIPTRGLPLAKRLADAVKKSERKTVPVGSVHITYRDGADGTVKPRPELKEYDINFSLDGKTAVVVDDVLYTGKTVRAALDAIAQIGNPKQILLAVLVDRGHRELPIKADFVGKELPTSADEIVSVSFKETDGEDGVTLFTLL